MDLTVKMNDVSNGGQGDQVSILLQNPNTSELILSSNWNGVQTALQNLGGGNVSVRSTPTAAASALRVISPALPEEIAPEVSPLSLSTYPNPSTSYFTIQVKSDNVKDAITMKVVDIRGRVIETRTNLKAGQAVQVGAAYTSGVYIIEITQAGKRQQLKLIKQ
jgi:hypothetical protein